MASSDSEESSLDTQEESYSSLSFSRSCSRSPISAFEGESSSQLYDDSLAPQRNLGIPRALSTYRRESSYSFQEFPREQIIQSFPRLYIGIDASVQTDASWLQSRARKRQKAMENQSQKKSDKEARRKKKLKKIKGALRKLATIPRWTMNKKIQDLEVLCNMEFTDDFQMFFEPLLETLPHVGPPAILAYKPEPPPQDVTFKWQVEPPACCEFCGRELGSFPSLDNVDFDSGHSANLFCCLEFKRLFEYILHEREILKTMQPPLELIPIGPHPAFGSEQEKIRAKEKAFRRDWGRKEGEMVKRGEREMTDGWRRQQERQMTRTFAFMSMEPEDVNLKQVRTINYHLSRDPTAKRKTPEDFIKTLEDRCVLTIDCDQIWTLPGIRKVEKEFLKKNYKNGKKFLTMFPDGTAQIFYPSGNLAAIVVNNKVKGFTCVIQDDASEKAAIRAIFNSSGKITCYYPNGTIWVNINLFGGQLSDQEGNRLRVWKWSSTKITPKPIVSFKPIFLALNNYLGVRILDQDKIIVSFLALGKQARMNLGTKLQILVHEEVPNLRYFTDEDLFLLAIIIRIRRLLSKINLCIAFPNIENWYKMKTPPYLATRAMRLLSLCHYYELDDEAISAITDILNEPI
ncbi:glutamate-rich protein 6 isoform X2 [Monodelphis domestica]|uniref:glutamate-rich protein 6 isoform X2 n=1 Tax=Monodelphis domestica TaxID=13616 RepID=UPI0024E25B65|nr:glutamate-rich protein 6 isoform X2 [Monodelphis domestica]